MTDIWGELDLDRWTWELPRSTPGPYVAEHIPKPLITDWVNKWKPIINDALEKAEKYDKYAKIADTDIKALNKSLRFYEKKLEAVKKWSHKLDTAVYNMSISLPPEEDRYVQVKAKALRDTMLMRDRIKDVLEAEGLDIQGEKVK